MHFVQRTPWHIWHESDWTLICYNFLPFSLKAFHLLKCIISEDNGHIKKMNLLGIYGVRYPPKVGISYCHFWSSHMSILLQLWSWPSLKMSNSSQEYYYCLCFNLALLISSFWAKKSKSFFHTFTNACHLCNESILLLSSTCTLIVLWVEASDQSSITSLRL